MLVEVVRCELTPESDQSGLDLYNSRRAASLSREEAAALLGILVSELVTLELGTSEPGNVTYADIVAEYRRAAKA